MEKKIFWNLSKIDEEIDSKRQGIEIFLVWLKEQACEEYGALY